MPEVVSPPIQKDPAGISCQYIKGVGPKRVLLLKKVGLETVADLLYLSPRRYEDRKNFTPIRYLRVGEFATVRAKIVASGVKNTRRRFTIFQLGLEDATGVLFATWFNQPYLREKFKVGSEAILSGKVQWYGRELQMMSPDYEVLEGDSTDLLHTGRIVPIYPLTEGLGQRTLRVIVRNAFDGYGKTLEEFLPQKILDQYHLIDLKEAVRAIHFPETMEAVDQARHRLAFQEFFLLELGLAIRRKNQEKFTRTLRYVGMAVHVEDFKKTLPFSLTHAQERAIADIVKDLQGSSPMNRLLQGDVGSGKTLVACCALYLAIQSGFQGALMVPTEVLAEQHFQTLEKVFSPFQIRVGLLIGEQKKSIRQKILNELQSGELKMVIGTHAVLEGDVAFKKLGMVVIDEQHKFGVAQRAALRDKGQTPDVLVMTATPIPRTLALTVYGDLDVSSIDEMPPGRGQLSTHWIRKNKLNDAYQFIQKEIKKGRQAFIIYPLVDESEKTELKAATKMFEHLSKEIFLEARLGLVHGRLKSLEKNEVLYQFRDQKIDILVSTTVIEVGIDIPNATLILVENAHAFGLAQLHQLRGRIGRGPLRSYCVLEGDPHTEEGVQRLQVMVDTRDGFKIAEADLSIRGPGEFLGTRQHGLPELRFGNLVTDFEIIQKARESAQHLLSADPILSRLEHRKLEPMLQKFLNRSDYLDVG